MAASEKTRKFIDKYRKIFGIKEKPTSEEERLIERAEVAARERRMEEAETEDGYVRLFHRDPWTDEWIGDGPEEDMPYLQEELDKVFGKKSAPDAKEAVSDVVAERLNIIERSRMPQYTKKSELTKKEKKTLKKELEKLQNLSKKKKKKYRDEMNRHIQSRLSNEAKYRDKYMYTYWLLCEFYKKSYAKLVIDEWLDKGLTFNEMVEEGYNEAWCIINLTNCVVDHTVSTEEACKLLRKERKERKEQEELEAKGYQFEAGLVWKPVNNIVEPLIYRSCDPTDGTDHEIPEVLEDDFEAWCKDNPLKKFRAKARILNTTAANVRKCKYLKMCNKRTKNLRETMLMTSHNYGGAEPYMMFRNYIHDEKEFKRLMKKKEKRFLKLRRKMDRLHEVCNLTSDYSLKSWLQDAQNECSNYPEKERKKRLREIRKHYEWYLKQSRDPDVVDRAEKERDEISEWFEKRDYEEQWAVEIQREEWLRRNGCNADLSNIPFKISRNHKTGELEVVPNKLGKKQRKKQLAKAAKDKSTPLPQKFVGLTEPKPTLREVLQMSLEQFAAL